MLQAHLQAGPGTDPSVNTALSTMQHIRDVLSGNAAHFNPATVAPLVQAAEADLLDETRATPTPDSSSAQPAKPDLLDDTSPGMPSSGAFAPLKQPIFQYPVAPARSPKPPSSVPMQPSASSSAGLPQLPKHSHQRMSSNSSQALLPKFGDWHIDQDTGLSNTFDQSSFARVPPLSRTVHPLEGFGIPPVARGATNPAQRHIDSRRAHDADPLGALLR